MAGTYYDIGVVTPIANIAAALTDKYGVYNDPANLNGYREHDNSAEYLLFECAAIAGNRFIRLRWHSETLEHQWGTGRSAENTLTSPIEFCGAYTVGSSFTRLDLVLHDDSYFICSEGGSRAGARVAIIGELSNGEYGIFGANTSSVGHSYSGSNYHIYNITTNTMLDAPNFFNGDMYTSADKIMQQNIALVDCGTRRILLDGMEDPIVFNNIVNVGHNASLDTIVLGTNFLISGGRLIWNTNPVVLASYYRGLSGLMATFTPAP